MIDSHKKILLAFGDFVHYYFGEYRRLEDRLPGRFDDVRAINLSGEAPATAMDQLRSVMKDVLPHQL